MYSRFGIGATGRATISSRAMPIWRPLPAVPPPVAAPPPRPGPPEPVGRAVFVGPEIRYGFVQGRFLGLQLLFRSSMLLDRRFVVLLLLAYLAHHVPEHRPGLLVVLEVLPAVDQHAG